MKRLFLFLLLAPLCFSTAVVNSLDGRDVVSTIYYAAVTGETVVFVPPASDGQIAYGKIGTGQDILLVQSAASPVITGMADGLRNGGNTVEMLVSEEPYETNLALAERSGAKKFVLVDPVYGYNAVSALAYAKLNSMYLIFVDKSNMEAVVSFLKGKNPQDILVYGYVDNEVKTSMAGNSLGYREINNGDKFDDNIELAGLYFQANPSKKQVILSDGNAFEDTLIAGDDPAILISPIVPTATYNYMKQEAGNGQIGVAMVVDTEYAQTAYDMKESINRELGSEKLHVLVKFGQSIAGMGMVDVEFFPVPGPVAGLEIGNVEYNTNSNELEVTYENTGNALEYVKSRIIVFVDGNYAGTVGEEEPVAIGRGERIGIGYPVDVESGEITANITSFYGSSKKYTENGLQGVFNAGRVEFSDRSMLGITEFTEDRETNDILVTFTNGGNITAYFRPDATITVQGTSTKIKDENTYELAAGEGRIVKFPGIAKSGSAIVAGADYGSREAFLEKRVEKEYTPAPAGLGFPLDSSLLYIIVILALIGAVGYLVWDKTRAKR
ncbi:hypothetical protein H0O02_00420 [Candidatus Micrarchaeota archaeon]|nr:hypothetical protein [Candidatus Micrarchaeota archaeon]